MVKMAKILTSRFDPKMAQILVLTRCQGGCGGGRGAKTEYTQIRVAKMNFDAIVGLLNTF